MTTPFSVHVCLVYIFSSIIVVYLKILVSSYLNFLRKYFLRHRFCIPTNVSDIIIEFRNVDILLYIDLQILFHTIYKLKANKRIRAVAHDKVYLHESNAR